MGVSKMLKRLNVYFKEMYPIIPRLFLGMLVFLEIYFIVFCNSGGTIQDITAMPWQNFGNAKRRVPPRCSHCGLR